jgi:hypothetical protein
MPASDFKRLSNSAGCPTPASVIPSAINALGLVIKAPGNGNPAGRGVLMSLQG